MCPVQPSILDEHMNLVCLLVFQSHQKSQGHEILAWVLVHFLIQQSKLKWMGHGEFQQFDWLGCWNLKCANWTMKYFVVIEEIIFYSASLIKHTFLGYVKMYIAVNSTKSIKVFYHFTPGNATLMANAHMRIACYHTVQIAHFHSQFKMQLGPFADWLLIYLCSGGGH